MLPTTVGIGIWTYLFCVCVCYEVWHIHKNTIHTHTQMYVWPSWRRVWHETNFSLPKHVAHTAIFVCRVSRIGWQNMRAKTLVTKVIYDYLNSLFTFASAKNSMQNNSTNDRRLQRIRWELEYIDLFFCISTSKWNPCTYSQMNMNILNSHVTNDNKNNVNEFNDGRHFSMSSKNRAKHRIWIYWKIVCHVVAWTGNTTWSFSRLLDVELAYDMTNAHVARNCVCVTKLEWCRCVVLCIFAFRRRYADVSVVKRLNTNPETLLARAYEKKQNRQYLRPLFCSVLHVRFWTSRMFRCHHFVEEMVIRCTRIHCFMAPWQHSLMNSHECRIAAIRTIF